MSARRQIIAALSEDSYGGIATLADVTHAEQLLDAYKAEVLAEAEARLADMTREADQQTEAMENEGADSASTMYAQYTGIRRARDEVRRMAGEKAAHAGATATPGLTIYRASHDSIVMVLYTTAAEARKHCEAFLRRESPTAWFDWIEDEEDGVAELVVTVNGEKLETGYLVTALVVASVYDEGAHA
jgi:hypothetical protein